MSTHTLIAVALCSLIATGSLHAQDATSQAADRAATEAIRTLLEEQVTAWNRGDLDAFMMAYWRGPDLVFTSGAEVRRGWQATYDRYRRRYGGDTDSMGKVAFEDLEITMLGAEAAWVLGRWRLRRDDGESGGIFTLVLQRLDEGWRIMHDHTSAQEH